MELLRELLSRSTADGSRTNALNHLQWMLTAVLVSVLIAFYQKAPDVLIYFLCAILIVLLVAYLVTHFYFMVRNPDALRSEKFTIEKMALERGLVGDNLSGVRKPNARDQFEYPTPTPPPVSLEDRP